MSDRIQIPCAQCGAMLGAPPEAAGKQIRCPRCKTVVSVPQSAAPVRRARRVTDEDEHIKPAPRRKDQASPSRTAPLSPSKGQKKPGSTGSAGSPNSSGRKIKPRRPVEENLFDDVDDLEYLDEPVSYDDPYGHPGLPPRQKSGKGTTRKHETTASASSEGGIGGNKEILGGILTMVGAVVWFVVGLFFFDLIFFYPPVMFVLGFIAFIKGIFSR